MGRHSTEGELDQHIPRLVSEKVLRKLELRGPPGITKSGLETIYRSWCRHVPFDNAQRLIHLHQGERTRLPGLPPQRFFTDWLTHGTGGLCVPAALAMRSLLRTLGFSAECILASINSCLVPNHLTVIVNFGNEAYVVDPVILCETPIRLSMEESRPLFSQVHKVHVGKSGAFWRLRYLTPARRDQQTCLLLGQTATPHEAAKLYQSTQRTLEFKRFNTVNYTRLNSPRGILTVVGTRVSRTSSEGVARHSWSSDIESVLVGEIGYSPEIVRKMRNTRAAGLWNNE